MTRLRLLGPLAVALAATLVFTPLASAQRGRGGFGGGRGGFGGARGGFGGGRGVRPPVGRGLGGVRNVGPSIGRGFGGVRGGVAPLRNLGGAGIHRTPFRAPLLRPRYRPLEWRRDHPGWNGRLFFNDGLYFYDPLFAYPATLDNEWTSIAALSGGVGLLGALENDPFLAFVGAAGELYSLSRYESDMHSDDPTDRLRAAYFARPFFWRNGVRYDRTIIYQDGREYYRFVRA